MSGSNVKGPASALSSFLRERGIRTQRINMYQRRLVVVDDENDNNGNEDRVDENQQQQLQQLQQLHQQLQHQQLQLENQEEEAGNVVALSSSVTATSTYVAPQHSHSTATITHANAAAESIRQEKAGNTSKKRTRSSTTTTAAAAASKKKKAKEDAVSKSSSSNKKKAGKGKHNQSDNTDNDDDDVFESNNNSMFPRSNHTKLNKNNSNYSLVRFCSNCNRRFILENNDDDQHSNHPPPPHELKCNACLGINTAKKSSLSSLSSSSAKKQRGTTKKTKIAGVNPLLTDNMTASTRVPSLKDLCIHFLADNIHSLDPEALSGTPFLPPTTKLAIAKIVSRRRQLNNELLEIFLGEEEERVELFDVARIDGTGFVKIASGCGESLKVLRLELAGRLDDISLQLFADRLTHLTTLHLTGIFLVTEPAFIHLFSTLAHQLTSVTLGDAAKLGGAALKVLVDRQGNSSSSTLKELRLYRCPRIGEAAIRVLATTTTSSSLKGLEKFAAVDCGGGQGGLLMHRRPLVPENEKQEEQENAEEGGGEDEMQLDTITTTATATTITAPPTTTSTTDNKENNAINDDDYTSNGKKLTDRTRHLKGEEEASDDAWIALISVIGPSLTELVIEGSYEITDKTIVDGISCFTHRLSQLSLANNDRLTDSGMRTLFQHLPAPTLHTLNLTRVIGIKDETCAEILSAHANTLKDISLNGLDNLGSLTLRALGGGIPNLSHLDISWIRAVNDEFMEDLLVGAGAIISHAQQSENRRQVGSSGSSRSRITNPKLQLVKLFGCHLVTECVLGREWWVEEGKEEGGVHSSTGGTHRRRRILLVGNEFD